MDQQIKQARMAWAATVGIDAAAVDDPRMPGPQDTPITLREWARLWCLAQNITDTAQIERRWKVIQRWPQRRKHFPAPLIPAWFRPQQGSVPAVFSLRQLDEWAAEHAPRPHHTAPALIERLASLTEPLTLTEISRVLDLYPSALTRARDASLQRIAQGLGGEVEVPDPLTGEHGGYRTTYHPGAWAHFWKNRPGQGVHLGA